MHNPLPTSCPRCRKPLYPLAHSRPEPRLCLAARLLFFGSIIVSTLTWWFAGIYIRWYLDIFVPVWMLTVALLPVALVPGLAGGLLAYRMRRVADYRCRHCGWHERLLWPWPAGRCQECGRKVRGVELCPGCSALFAGRRRDCQPAASAAPFVAHEPPPQPLPLPIDAEDSLDGVIDDTASHKALGDWIYGAFAAGRDTDDVVAELVAHGWSEQSIAELVGQKRRETRDVHRQRLRHASQ